MMRTAALHAIEPNEATGVALLGNAAQASAILYHPVRLRILEALLLPDSAAGLSRRMGIPRQTLVRMVQSGFFTAADWENERFDSTSYGWEFILLSLRVRLERHREAKREVAAALGGLKPGASV